MTKNHPNTPCRCRHRACSLRAKTCPKNALPLSQACAHGRVKVCKVRGNRKLCARMAALGVLPGREMELICAGHGHQCMVRIDGGTISLDKLSTDNILVTPT